MADNDNNWFNNWPDGLIGLNKHQRIVEVSPMAQSILGYTREELYGRQPHEALCAKAGDYGHDASVCILTAIHDGQETTSTLWQHKNGHLVSIDFRLIPVAHNEASRVISFIDNSTRLHNQAEMEKFSQYVEMSPAPLAEFVMDGQLLFGNTALQSLILEYGFDEDGAAKVIPKNIGDIGQTLQRSPEGVDFAEVQLDDRVFVWHFHILESNDEPESATMVGYAFDITKQKEAEAFANKQRSEARKEFYAKMVHELRSPLNAIVGFSDLLQMELDGQITDSDMDKLRLIREAGMQLNEQVTATLDIAKIESGKMRIDISDFSVADVCREVMEQMAPLAAEKELKLHSSIFTEQRVFSDRTKVRQIVVNLISNSIKYTKKGGIHVIISAFDHAELGECISLVVSDTGIGIKEEAIPRLFESFEQAEDAQTKDVEGTGLGLSLVGNLIKLLGGRVKVESEYGNGTMFEVLLPFSSSHTPDVQSTEVELI